jgi:hypothetical protein
MIRMDESWCLRKKTTMMTAYPPTELQASRLDDPCKRGEAQILTAEAPPAHI